MLFFIGFSPATSEGMGSEVDTYPVPRQISQHHMPGITATFNRNKYYSRLVHPSDNRMVR